MERLIYMLVSCFCVVSLAAQPLGMDWARTFGGPGAEDAGSIAIDQYENVYVVGDFSDSLDIDPGPNVSMVYSAGYTDIFIQKYDSDGNLLWVKTIGGIGIDEARGVAVDDSLNVIITGKFEGTVDFDPDVGVHNQTTLSATDAFVLKLDDSGQLVWVAPFGGNGNQQGERVAADKDGNIFVVGEFAYAVDFDPGPNTTIITAMTFDVFVLKLDRAGNFGWVAPFYGSSSCFGQGFAIDTSANVYVTGMMKGTVDYDPGPGTDFHTNVGSHHDIYIVKLDSSGNHLWARTIGGTGYDWGKQIVVDVSGNSYSTGSFQDTVDFDPGQGVNNLYQSSNVNYRMYVLKLDPNGNFLWARAPQGGGGDVGLGVATDGGGNVYTLGHYTFAVDFDPGPNDSILSTTIHDNVFLQKLDSTGDFQWVLDIGSPNSGDLGKEIVVHSSGSLYLSGIYTDTTDVDPGTGYYPRACAGFRDVFVEKLDFCNPIYDIQTVFTCDSFQWIDGNTYGENTTYPSALITNPNGCDSVLRLDLTVSINAPTTEIVTACDTFTWIDGNTYAISTNTPSIILYDTYDCDSVVFLDLTIIDHDTSVSVNNITLESSAVGVGYQWIDCITGSAISGATDASFTPSADGSYAVIVSGNGCSDTSACYDVTGVAVIELENESVSVYPNPTNGLFAISLKRSFESLQVNVYNVAGQVVFSDERKRAEDTEFNIGDLPSGLYIVEFYLDDRRHVKRLSLSRKQGQ